MIRLATAPEAGATFHERLARSAAGRPREPRGGVRIPVAGVERGAAIAFDGALATLEARGDCVTVHLADGRTVTLRADALDVLAEVLGLLEAPPLALPGAVPMPSLIGYLGYELGAPRSVPRHPLPDAWWVAPRRAWVWPDAARPDAIRIELRGAARALGRWLEAVPDACRVRPAHAAPAPPPRSPHAVPGYPGLSSDLDPAAYRDRVERIREWIAAGDVYQANLSQRFEAPCQASGLALFDAFERAHPAAHAAYLDAGATAAGPFEVVSNSPEQFVRRCGDALSIRPIKGTRRRADAPAQDAKQLAALLASAKDAAEHVMIVDLVRNDLGRVAATSTVAVPALASPESLRTVHHLVSTVTARARPDVGLADLLRATFPCGSVTGAPKRRAMEVLREVEPTPRGPYTGAIGVLSANGDVALNVAIRTAIVAGGRVEYRAGGGIVTDSDATSEWDETLAKAEALVAALAAARGSGEPSASSVRRAVDRAWGTGP